MPDILIRGMEMPENCIDCPCMVDKNGGGNCCLQSEEANEKIESWDDMKAGCPLHELPPHGDLIEAEHLAETLDYYIREAGWGDEINEALRWVRDEFIKSETVIVPASEEGG